jgi:AcrR family transcriptional regulator
MRRTRQLLQGALRTLMQTRSFDEIAVQDIAEVATVNRATFYDHYTDKYALLEAMAAGGFYALLHERNVLYDGLCPSAAQAIILAACDYLTQAHGGSECDRQSSFEPLMDAAVIAAIRRVLMDGLANSSSGLQTQMIATTASWAIFGAVKEWYRTPGHPPAEEVVPLIMEFVLPILQSAQSSSPHPADVNR